MGVVEQAEISEAQARLSRRVRAWVKCGLLQFWQSALPEDQMIAPLLRAAITRDWPEAATSTWAQNCSALETQINECDTPLAQLCHDYQLSPGERFILALLGELQAEHSVNLAIRELQLPDTSAHLSVHLAVELVERLFANTATVNFHTALLHSPLLRDHLIHLDNNGTLPLCKLQIAPVSWAVLSGQAPPWPGCRYFLQREAGELSAESAAEALKIASLLEQDETCSAATLVIRGVPDSGRSAFALAVAGHLGLTAIQVPEKVWAAESALPSLCCYAKWLPVITPEITPGRAFKVDKQSPQKSPVAVIVGIDGAVDGAALIDVETQLPQQQERTERWQQHLADKTLAENLGRSAILSLNSISKLAQHARQLAARENSGVQLSHILTARRYYGAEKLRTLAESVNKTVQRDAMAFNASVQEGLDLLLLRASKRESIWRHLGRTLKVTPTPGVRGLFVGESGTGKTLAASYIASQLSAPLYRVDLSSVMNKYIGESEKNLSQLLDYAAATDVVLLFDEADSLFGSRSEGKETGERFANMLTNFLLTRIENHPGVVILTTNGKERIDKAFNRRIDVEVEFPLPAYSERLELWLSHLGEQAINEEAFRTIASHCDFTGGQVRNAVLAAATYADDAIRLPELLRGIFLEYGKLGHKVPRAIELLRKPQD